MHVEPEDPKALWSNYFHEKDVPIDLFVPVIEEDEAGRRQGYSLATLLDHVATELRRSRPSSIMLEPLLLQI